MSSCINYDRENLCEICGGPRGVIVLNLDGFERILTSHIKDLHIVRGALALVAGAQQEYDCV